MSTDEKYKIELPPELTQKLRTAMQKSSFRSLDDFILYILQDFIDQNRSENTNTDVSAEITTRLRNLGYL